MRWRVLNLAETTPFPGLWEPLESLAEVVTLPASTENLERELPRAQAYFSGLSVRLSQPLIARCPSLQLVCSPSTGWDHLDHEALRQRGIPLLSLRGEDQFLDSITATAELSWGLLLAVLRRLREGTRLTAEGIWARDECRGYQLSGKTLGILGCGRLGRMVAEYGRAFRMRVLACDPGKTDFPEHVTPVTMDELLRQSDVLSIHVHLTPENVGLLGREEIFRMKRGAVLLNTSRGALLDEEALVEALESGQLMGAGLDVIDGEWNSDLNDHPLVRLAGKNENLVIMPHVGGVTHESQRATYAFMVEKLRAWILEAGENPAARCQRS